MRGRELGISGGAAILPCIGRAQAAWESRPVRLIAPFVAGAPSGAIARFVAARLGKPLSTFIVVENRAEAGGLIAANRVSHVTLDDTYPGSGKRLAHWAAYGLAALFLTSPAWAQTVQLGAQGVVKSKGLGRAFETFSVFGGVPGIAAARYDSDFRLNTFQLPVAHTFEPSGGGSFAGISPYAEMTLGYLTADQRFPLEGGQLSPNSVKLSFDSLSALAGGGIEVPLASGWRLQALALAGYAHVSGNAAFSGPSSAFVQSAVRGILDKAAVDTALFGGAVALVFETRFAGDVTLAAKARYNQLATVVTSATNPALRQNGSFGVAIGGLTLSGPTEWRIAARPLRWIGYTNGTWLPNTDRGTLGFNAFAEIGGGLQLLAPDIVSGVKGGTLRAGAIVGPAVTGWLVSAALNF